jgi:hypothetical protein
MPRPSHPRLDNCNYTWRRVMKLLIMQFSTNRCIDWLTQNIYTDGQIRDILVKETKGSAGAQLLVHLGTGVGRSPVCRGMTGAGLGYLPLSCPRKCQCLTWFGYRLCMGWVPGHLERLKSGNLWALVEVEAPETAQEILGGGPNRGLSASATLKIALVLKSIQSKRWERLHTTRCIRQTYQVDSLLVC